jgi:hypothetical protein
MALRDKYRGPGRPEGAPNIKTGHTRTKNINYRCSPGYKKIVEILAQQMEISQADVLHQALHQFAIKHVKNVNHLHYLNTII